MIVTKEMAAKYLIRRACYMIGPAPNGNFTLVSTSVNWKEGMEVFEDRDECARELDRRRRERMASGNCPRCNYKGTDEAEINMTRLMLLKEAKGAQVYRCASCQTGWFKPGRGKISYSYDASVVDLLLEWCDRDLKPSKSMKGVLDTIGDISVTNDFAYYPVHAIMKDGKKIEAALLRLQAGPPSPETFGRSDWHYLDQVKDVRPSPYAYPKGIAKDILHAIDKGKWDTIYVRDIDSNKRYSFFAHAGPFMPQELKGKQFERFTPEKNHKGIFHYFTPDDRGGPGTWSMQPVDEVMIWGDPI